MTPNPALAERTAIVTGASSGIGRETALGLAEEGADVVVSARREAELEALAETIREETGAAARAVPADVGVEDDAEGIVETAVAEYGGIDVLVNNAGTAAGSDVESMTTETYRTMMDTNVDGMFFTTRAALPHLRESSGSLVFIGSFAGKYPRPFNPVYAASKWWTRGFAQSVSAQVGDDVAVTVVNPSEVRTEFGSEYGESFADRFEPGEVTEPGEIADAVVFAATRGPSMVAELDLYRRDKFTMF